MSAHHVVMDRRLFYDRQGWIDWYVMYRGFIERSIENNGHGDHEVEEMMLRSATQTLERLRRGDDLCTIFPHITPRDE